MGMLLGGSGIVSAKAEPTGDQGSKEGTELRAVSRQQEQRKLGTPAISLI